MAKKVYPGQVVNVYAKSGGAATASRGNRSVKAMRSDENKGHPLALVALNQKRAPWMEFAVAELKRWGGVDEKIISKTINYHQKIGLDPSYGLGSTAWCASFVNYCLKLAGYKGTNSPGSQTFIGSKNFYELKVPVYGALVVYRNPARPGYGHVAFVYSKLKGGDLAVLGGNQADSVTFNAHDAWYIKHVKYKLAGFYVPLVYKEYAEKQLAAGGDLGKEEYTIETLRAAFGKSAEVTAKDRKTT